MKFNSSVHRGTTSPMPMRWHGRWWTWKEEEKEKAVRCRRKMDVRPQAWPCASASEKEKDAWKDPFLPPVPPKVGVVQRPSSIWIDRHRRLW